MQRIKRFEKMLSGEYVDYYELSRVFSKGDIRQIIETLYENGVTFRNFRLSNSLEQPEHFFRLFPDLKSLYACPIEDYWVDDFGVACIYNDKNCSLTFYLGSNRAHTITNGDVDLESLLIKLENT